MKIKNCFYVLIISVFLGACGGSSDVSNPQGGNGNRKSGDKGKGAKGDKANPKVVLLCKCGDGNNFLLGKGDNETLAKQHAEKKCKRGTISGCEIADL